MTRNPPAYASIEVTRHRRGSSTVDPSGRRRVRPTTYARRGARVRGSASTSGSADPEGTAVVVGAVVGVALGCASGAASSAALEHPTVTGSRVSSRATGNVLTCL